MTSKTKRTRSAKFTCGRFRNKLPKVGNAPESWLCSGCSGSKLHYGAEPMFSTNVGPSALQGMFVSSGPKL